jgi:hypothetical protein
MKDVLEQQSKHLENLDNSAKKDTLIQLLQLREEMKIDKEDAEHLEKVKETNKILDRAVNIDINMAKDVKTVTEAVAGKEEIERKKQEAETFKELQKSVEKLTKILAKKEYLKKPENVESGNKTFGAGQKAPTKATGQNSKLDEQPLTAENVGEKLKSKRQVYRDKQAQEGSMLRRILVGQDKESVFEPMLKKREDAKADKKMAKDERKAAIKGAKENDPGTIGVGNFHGTPKWYDLAGKYKKNKAMNDYAGAKYDALKEKEDSVLKSQDDIDRSKSFGYAPKVKDVKALKKASKEYVESPDNLAKNSQDRADARAEKAHAKEAARTEKVAAKEAVTQPPTQFTQSSEDKEEGKAERQKFEADTIISATKETEEMHGIGATLLASLAVHKDILQAIKEGGMGGGDGGGSLIDDALSLGKKGLKAGGSLLSRGAGMLRAAAPAIGSAAITYAGAAAGGYVVDAGLGALGVGKDKEGKDLQIDEKKDDANWEKMSLGEKAQSGMARGVEKLGKLFFLDNLVREAQADRIKNESAYFDKKEGKVPEGSKETSSRTEQNFDMKFNDGKPTINGQAVSVEDYTKAFNTPLEKQPEVIKSILNKPVAEGSGTAGAIENKTNELNNVKDAAGKGSTGNIIAAPVTNISSVNTQNNQTRMPVRSEDNTLNRYIGSRYAPF